MTSQTNQVSQLQKETKISNEASFGYLCTKIERDTLTIEAVSLRPWLANLMLPTEILPYAAFRGKTECAPKAHVFLNHVTNA